MNLPLFQLAARKAWQDMTSKKVMSGRFIAPFEAYGVSELRRAGLHTGSWDSVNMKFWYRRSTRLLGSTFPKPIDVWFGGHASGPLLGISYKSLLFSIPGNVNNRWEEAAGEAANLHGRFPMLVLGFLLVLPYSEYKRDTLLPTGRDLVDASGRPTSLGLTIERRFRGARPRRDSVQQGAMFEEVALAVVDFTATPPVLHPTFPSPGSGLRVDNFFEKLATRFRERNRFL